MAPTCCRVCPKATARIANAFTRIPAWGWVRDHCSNSANCSPVNIVHLHSVNEVYQEGLCAESYIFKND
jgi:hypothetical protein